MEELPSDRIPVKPSIFVLSHKNVKLYLKDQCLSDNNMAMGLPILCSAMIMTNVKMIWL